MKRSLVLAVVLGTIALISARAESRFDRPVIKVAEPKKYNFFKLDDNNFPSLSSEHAAVSCMVYRGTKRYYVEVAVVNRSTQPLTLQRDFVSFEKPGYTVIRANTLASAVDISASVSGAFIPTPPPPPTRATTTYSGTANTYGNTTYASGTATTTVDNSAAGWHALGQAIAARRYYNAQGREQNFANYLVSFGYETQPLVIEPQKAQLYIYTFEQIKQKKAPFRILVRVGPEEFPFAYKG